MALTPPILRLVLASGSASRLRVLRDAGFDPTVVVSGVDEGFDGLNPAQAVVAIAERKASAVADRCRDSLVIVCDSMLELDGEALGKPVSRRETREIWRRLSNRRASLNTGHCLIETAAGRRRSRLVSSIVESRRTQRRRGRLICRHRRTVRSGRRIQYRRIVRTFRQGGVRQPQQRSRPFLAGSAGHASRSLASRSPTCGDRIAWERPRPRTPSRGTTSARSVSPMPRPLLAIGRGGHSGPSSERPD